MNLHMFIWDDRTFIFLAKTRETFANAIIYFVYLTLHK
jgi:hypothetical protein